MKIDRFIKSAVLLNGLTPLALLGLDALGSHLGANPVNYAIRTTGLLALIFLTLSLAVTPAMRITGWNWLGTFRRMLGLLAFFHAGLHFLLFFGFDRNASIRSTISEVFIRPYLLVGMVSLGIMLPLAITSTDRMIRRLGSRRWKALHRLAYIAAVAGVLHFDMLVKSDATRPHAFAVVLGILLSFRLVEHYFHLRSEAWKFRAGPPPVIPGRPKRWSGKLRVARTFKETPEICTFRFVNPDGDRLPFDFLPGQYLNISLMIDGRKVNRSYTIASPPTRTGYCEISVKREAMGLASKHLHDMLRENSLVDISAPAGKFTFTGMEAGSIVMIAAGVGITPLMSKLRYLTDLGWPGDIFFILSVKGESDIPFRSELEALRARNPNLHLTITLTRDAGTAWMGERGRLTSELLARVVPDIAGRRVHLCGPTEMTEPTRALLVGLGVSEKAIFSEAFTSPSRNASGSEPAPAMAEGTPVDAEVSFALSGKMAMVAASKTILEAAEDLGIAIPYDCRAGTCGTCKVPLLSGRVAMDSEDALTPADRANGLILACQARCLEDVELQA